MAIFIFLFTSILFGFFLPVIIAIALIAYFRHRLGFGGNIRETIQRKIDEHSSRQEHKTDVGQSTTAGTKGPIERNRSKAEDAEYREISNS